jgi:hypothetical protein
MRCGNLTILQVKEGVSRMIIEITGGMKGIRCGGMKGRSFELIIQIRFRYNCATVDIVA